MVMKIISNDYRNIIEIYLYLHNIIREVTCLNDIFLSLCYLQVTTLFLQYFQILYVYEVKPIVIIITKDIKRNIGNSYDGF